MTRRFIRVSIWVTKFLAHHNLDRQLDTFRENLDSCLASLNLLLLSAPNLQATVD